MVNGPRKLLLGSLCCGLGWPVAAILLGATPAVAGSNSISIEVANDRDPDDFGTSKDMKYEISGAHAFGNGVSVGGSFQYTDPAHGGADSRNLEATVGYRLPLADAWAVNGSVGIGGRFKSANSDFAYYVLRIGASVELSDRLTWDVVRYRYRNAFDTDNHYDTPELATAMALKVTKVDSVTARFYRGWEDGTPNETGIALGFKHEF